MDNQVPQVPVIVDLELRERKHMRMRENERETERYRERERERAPTCAGKQKLYLIVCVFKYLNFSCDGMRSLHQLRWLQDQKKCEKTEQQQIHEDNGQFL